MNGIVFVISAPSGTGKTTLTYAALAKLRATYPIERVVTYTSRLPRPGEVQGVDYHFISVKEFEDKIKAGFFFESSTWYGTYYGLPACFIDKAQKGISCVIVLDRYGARSIKAKYPAAVLIWLEPESLEVLRGRLKGRGDTAPDEIERRLEKAVVEIEEERKEKLYNFHIVVRNIESGVDQMVKYMMQVICAK